MRHTLLISVGLTLCMSMTSYANSDTSNASFKTALVSIIQQLQSLNPLIQQAERAQSSQARYQVHFDAWVDAQGQSHAGLREDITAIRQALLHALHRSTLEPRMITPLKHDFVDTR